MCTLINVAIKTNNDYLMQHKNRLKMKSIHKKYLCLLYKDPNCVGNCMINCYREDYTQKYT